ncbi:MAG: sigma-70 family RNA polymerase sigma factor [Armatimonadota bacterium]
MIVGVHQSAPYRLSCLTDEEAIALAQRGSRAATEILLGRYRYLVEGKARSYFLSGAEHEDVVQEGMIGLYKAIRDFQAGRLVRFRSFAEVCVTRQIISAVKTASRRKHLPLNRYVPIERPAGEEQCLPRELCVEVRFDDDRSDLDARLEEYLARHASSELSELENHAIRGRLEGKTYEQVAQELHCRPKCVDNALQRARRKIWSHLSRGQD